MTGLYKQSNARRRQFVQLLTDLDQYWIEVLGNKLFHDLNYYDLFTQMWLRIDSSEDDTFRKSELYKLMPHISQRTAIKYIQTAIDHGLLIERMDPQDQRSRQITMSADLRRKIELFLDRSISMLREISWQAD
ncbi:MAG: MarR family transcriptional regulator [Nitrosospira multiformis]|nr:MarR family transcriptional regulator [Nitrosospira multiformis]